jgi:hypothetical protein
VLFGILRINFLSFRQSVDTLFTTENLRKIFRFSIRDSPFVLFRLELWCFFFTIILFYRIFRGLRLIIIITLWFLFNRWWFRKNLIFIYIVINDIWFFLVLETNNSIDFTNDLLNHEELVHEPHLKLIFNASKL